MEHYPVYSTQSEMYAVLMKDYKLTNELFGYTDYFKVGDIGGVLYYAPNDETWGCVIAVSHEHKLARDTGFYEMDDMEYPDSDYAQVVHNGQLMCKFETE